MKTLLVTLSMALAGVSIAEAQVYRPSVVGRTTVLGAVAGALIGGHNDDRWAEGALIGAAAGAVLGTIADQSRPVVTQPNGFAPVAVVPNAPVVGAAVPTVAVSSPPSVVYVEPSPAAVAAPLVVSAVLGYYAWDHHNHHYHGHYSHHGHGGHHGYSYNRHGHRGGGHKGSHGHRGHR